MTGISSTLRRCWSCTVHREGGGVVCCYPATVHEPSSSLRQSGRRLTIALWSADPSPASPVQTTTALPYVRTTRLCECSSQLLFAFRRKRSSGPRCAFSSFEHLRLSSLLVEVGAGKATSGSRQTGGGTIQGPGKQRGWNDKEHTWCYRIRAVSGGTWIADIQDQGVFPVRRSRGNRRCRVVRGRGPRPERFCRCRSGRRCDQAAHRPQGWQPVGRVPHDRAVSQGRARVSSSTASPRAVGRTFAGTS